LKNIDKARIDRAKQRKKRKNNISRGLAPGGSVGAGSVESGVATPSINTESTEGAEGDAAAATADMQVEGGDEEVPEEKMREREREMVKDLIKAQEGAVDKGANQTGLYELCGESRTDLHQSFLVWRSVNTGCLTLNSIVRRAWWDFLS
jgi:hypothetical protein